MRARQWTGIAAVALLATMYGGCGEDRSGAGGHEPAATTATQPPLTAAVGDRTLARRALVRLVDFPAGWGEQPTPVPEVGCGDVKPFAGAAAVVGSGRLVLDNTGVQETVAVFPTAAASRRAYAAINSRRAMRCLRRSVRAHMAAQAGGTASPLAASRVERLGRWGVAMRFTASARGGFGELPGYIDAVHVRVGRGLGALLIVSGLAPLSDEVYMHVVELFSERLRRALA